MRIRNIISLSFCTLIATSLLPLDATAPRDFFNQTYATTTCSSTTQSRWRVTNVTLGSNCDAAAANDVCLAYYMPNITDANPANRSRDAGFIRIKITEFSAGNCDNFRLNIGDIHYLGVKSNAHLDGILATQCIEMIDDYVDTGGCVGATSTTLE